MLKVNNEDTRRIPIAGVFIDDFKQVQPNILEFFLTYCKTPRNKFGTTTSFCKEISLDTEGLTKSISKEAYLFPLISAHGA